MPNPIRRRGVWPLLLCFALLAGCGGEQTTQSIDLPTADQEAVSPQRAIRISQGSDLLTCDPYQILESPSWTIQRNIFDPLTDVDGEMQLKPCLAESWEHTDPLTWVFRLRQGVTFQNGNPFTSDDALYSLERAKHWERSRVKSEIETIVKVEAPDAATLRITTAQPDAILPLRLAQVLMLDRETCEPAIAEHGDEWLANNANGTGAYRLAAWERDSLLRLEAFPQHWDGEPQAKALEFLPISNAATRMAALQRGELDLLIDLPTAFVEQARAIPGLHVVQQPGLRLIYLGLDCGREQTPGFTGGKNPLLDKRVREAILLGIDNRAIVQTTMNGMAEPADQLIPQGMVGYDPAITLTRPDYDRAKALLAEAGYAQGFTIRLDGPNDRYVNDAKIMQSVAQELARIGITVTVNAQPKSRFFAEEIAGNCSFFLLGWTNANGDGIGTFDHLLRTFDPVRGFGASNRSTNYSNAGLDAACEASSSEFDPAKRNALIQRANRIATEDFVHIPLHFQMDIYAVSDKLDFKPRRDTHVHGRDLKWKP